MLPNEFFCLFVFLINYNREIYSYITHQVQYIVNDGLDAMYLFVCYHNEE